MKKVLIVLGLVVGGFAAVQAQDSTSTKQNAQQYPTSTTQDEQDREKINSRDLPDAVKRSLEGQEYRGWLVNAAYKSNGITSSSDATSTGSQNDSTSVSGTKTGAYAQEAYVVELKNGAQTKTVRFDKDGKKLDDNGLKNDQD